MNKDYYNDALRWYYAIYVHCARDRNLLICIFIIIVLCLLQMCFAIKMFYDTKDVVRQYVIYTNHDEGLSLSFKRLDTNFSISNFLHQFIIIKYVENMEIFKFDKNKQSAMRLLQKKAQIIKNTSSDFVYQKYIDGVYKDDYGDLSLLLSDQQKDISIEKIDFLRQYSALTDKFYSIIGESKPNIANVIFVVRIFSKKSEIKKRYKVQITFSLNKGENIKTNQSINMKVYDYSKVEIKE